MSADIPEQTKQMTDSDMKSALENLNKSKFHEENLNELKSVNESLIGIKDEYIKISKENKELTEKQSTELKKILDTFKDDYLKNSNEGTKTLKDSIKEFREENTKIAEGDVSGKHLKDLNKNIDSFIGEYIKESETKKLISKKQADRIKRSILDLEISNRADADFISSAILGTSTHTTNNSLSPTKPSSKMSSENEGVSLLERIAISSESILNHFLQEEMEEDKAELSAFGKRKSSKQSSKISVSKDKGSGDGIFDKIFDSIFSGLIRKVASVVGIFGLAAGALLSVDFSVVKDKLVAAGSWMLDKLVDSGKMIISMADDIFGGVFDKIKGTLSSIIGAVTEFIKPVTDKIKSIFGKIAGVIQSALKPITKWIGGLLGWKNEDEKKKEGLARTKTIMSKEAIVAKKMDESGLTERLGGKDAHSNISMVTGAAGDKKKLMELIKNKGLQKDDLNIIELQVKNKIGEEQRRLDRVKDEAGIWVSDADKKNIEIQKLALKQAKERHSNVLQIKRETETGVKIEKDTRVTAIQQAADADAITTTTMENILTSIDSTLKSGLEEGKKSTEKIAQESYRGAVNNTNKTNGFDSRSYSPSFGGTLNPNLAASMG